MVGGGYIIKRAIQLLVPFIVYSILTWTFWGGCSPVEVLQKPSKGLWFLLVLYNLNIAIIFICYLNKKYISNVTLCILLSYVFLLLLAGVFKDVLAAHLTAYYFPYFLGGLYLKRCFQKNELTNVKLSCCSLIIWLFMAYYWQVDAAPLFFNSINSPVILKIIMYLWHYTTAILAIYGFLGLFRTIFDKNIKSVLFVGRNTLGIYALHFYMLNILSPIDGYFDTSSFHYVLIMLFLTISMSLLTIRLIKYNKYLSFLLLGIPLNKKIK